WARRRFPARAGSDCSMPHSRLCAAMQRSPASAVAGSERPTRARYLVLAALCLGATVAYVQRNSLGAAETVIRADLQLTKREMGWVMSSFFVSYALFQLPSGWWGHRLGTRRGLTLFAALWSVATATIGLCTGMPALIASRLAMGGAQAGLFPCCTQTVALWFPRTQRGFPSGALGAFQSVGGALGTALTGWLVGAQVLGWRSVYVLYAVPGLLAAAAFYFWFRDRPEDHAQVNAPELALIRQGCDLDGDTAALMLPPEPTPWLGMLKSVPLWAICWVQVFRAAGYIFFATWFTTYLVESRHLSITRSGWLTSMPLLAIVAGQLFGGWLSDWILQQTGSRDWARKWLSVASMLGCAGCIVVAIFLSSAYAAVAAIGVGAFVGAIGAPCSYAITIDMGGRHVPMVFSVMNMAGNVGAIGFPVAVPYVLQATGSWVAVLWLFAAMYVAAGLCWLVIDTRGTVFDRGVRH
ncbi:MAG: MFS transporter, partial [Pirellulales bacterium]|nr:MFS transporter [Pirellulales bacterium]